ncbi:hypothetical protein M2152_001747 [Microbacteriaceae bacterium SG_E_30_P1]|uniref:Uncharacterized protein n=1 Tax=Antiquaquibacter oligotrophicus TaxID=2880260 RepID=A0ABT6KNI7_9MICO|nr:hypothetical protein [Antiquaquibacter oligotrophicus]MDH6181565.1 hypothetical protein [Antiquaquibacter oligotrophicus]UDF12747.1 hypothetical protein LH407_11365 [Antiquaquibacter oligotrophicus]
MSSDPEPWTWTERRRFLRRVIAVIWILYGVPALIFSLDYLYPPIIAVKLVLLLGTPAVLHLLWVYFSEYYELPGPRVRLSDQMLAQVSRNTNHKYESAVARLPSDMSDLPLLGAEDPGPHPTLRVYSSFDTWLLNGALAAGLLAARPNKGMSITLLVEPSGITVLGGWWRPAILFTVPTTQICGLWDGDSISTIGDRDVLVVVVCTEDGQVLLPFDVKHWNDGGAKKFRTQELIERMGGVLAV